MVDSARVRRLLELLERYRGALERLAELPRDDYERAHAYEGRYLVQISAQCCIDIASHLIASEGWRTAKDFRDSFTVLGEHAVIDPALVERLQEMAGMRNRLVHVYPEIDDGLVYDAIRPGLRDTSAFASAIAALL